MMEFSEDNLKKIIDINKKGDIIKPRRAMSNAKATKIVYTVREKTKAESNIEGTILMTGIPPSGVQTEEQERTSATHTMEKN